MRSTWIVLGVVLAGGAFGYAKLRAKAEATPPLARPAGEPAGGGVPADPHAAPASAGVERPASPTAATPPDERELRAQKVVLALREKVEAKDEASAATLEKELDAPDLRDTAAARRHALERGAAALRWAEGKPPAEALPLLDRGRRDLSRALFLPELFDATTGKPTADRVRLVQTIESANARVMTAPGGIPNVTKPYVVRGGDSPVGIVTRDRLPYGHNALLHWNHGNLDPTRLRSGETLLLPLEPVTVRVDLAHKLLGVYVGDWLAREFEVGIGAAATPTPPGDYVVGDKQLNPDWHPPGGKPIKYGDPANELGDAWIAIGSPEKPTGYGIHGTNRPDTVGTACSHGCVRLANAQAVEVYWWVRTGRSGGQATRVIVR
jgi:hypothetical protein